MISRLGELYRGVVYASRACAEIDYAALDALIAHAQEKNKRLGITGVLCYKRGWFLQYFEGPEGATLDLMNQIKSDTRHEVVRSADLYPIDSRRFQTWSMRLIDDREPSNITLEDIVFDGALIRSPDDPNSEWWNTLAWRVVEKLAALHATEVA